MTFFGEFFNVTQGPPLDFLWRKLDLAQIGNNELQI